MNQVSGRNSRGVPIPAEVRAYLKIPEVRERIRSLQGPATRQFLTRVGLDYALIAAAISVCVFSFGSWWLLLTYPAAVLVIAARQHGLLILMHDATHYLAANNRNLNEWLGELLTAAPLFASMHSYRKNHLEHHQALNTPNDPDWVRKIEPVDERGHWIFPAHTKLPELMAGLYKRSIGYLIRSLRDNSTSPTTTNSPSDNSLRARTRTRNLGYLVLILALIYTKTWVYFISLWVVPMLLVLPMLMRLRSIAEHFALAHDHPLRESRNILPNVVERFLLAPHNIGAHLDHHIVASVPVHNLPALHRLLMQCDYFRAHAHNNDGYLLGRNTLLDDMYHQTSARLAADNESAARLRDPAMA